ADARWPQWIRLSWPTSPHRDRNMSPSEKREQGSDSHNATAQPRFADRTRDPVCGMGVDPNTAPYRVERGGTTTYFCSERRRLHLSDASADPTQRAGKLSDLRHDTRASRGHFRGW